MMTLANVVTLVRLGFIVPIVLSLGWGNRMVSLILVLCFFLGDLLDGHLARTRNEITQLGKFLDPLADKLLAFGLMLWFAWAGELSGWVIGLLFVQNALLLWGSLRLFRRGRTTVAARLSGKLAATLLALGLVLLYLKISHAESVIYVGIAFSYWAAFDYCLVTMRAR